MKSARATAAVAAGLLVLAIVAGSPASAGVPPPTGTITVEPTSGPPGRDFQFSGEGGVSEAGPGVVDVAVFFEFETLITQSDPGLVVPDEDGSWGFGFVPIGFFPTAADAVGTYDVRASCIDAETEQVLFTYEDSTFEVTAPTTPPTTVPEPPPAPPAAPVPAPPTFTG